VRATQPATLSFRVTGPSCPAPTLLAAFEGPFPTNGPPFASHTEVARATVFETKDLRYFARLSGPHSGAFPGQRRHPHPSFLAPILLFFSFVAPVSVTGSPKPAGPARPFKPETMEAFVSYVRTTDARNTAELREGQNLLWIDALPARARAGAYDSLAKGELQIEQRNSLSDAREIPCPDGIIHHWEGLAFIPGAHLDDVLRVVEDYNRHSVYYSPEVVRSKIESQQGNHFQVFLRFRRQKVITVVLDSEHDVDYFRDAPGLAHSRSSATHIAEVDSPGKSNEHEKPRDEDNGFLWGMETWWRFEEKNGGVYVQSEVVSLTRDIPSGLAWMIGPLVSAIPKESLTFTLEATRKAVLAEIARSAK